MHTKRLKKFTNLLQTRFCFIRKFTTDTSLQKCDIGRVACDFAESFFIVTNEVASNVKQEVKLIK